MSSTPILLKGWEPISKGHRSVPSAEGAELVCSRHLYFFHIYIQHTCISTVCYDVCVYGIYIYIWNPVISYLYDICIRHIAVIYVHIISYESRWPYSKKRQISLCLCIHLHIYIYMYMYTHVHLIDITIRGNIFNPSRIAIRHWTIDTGLRVQAQSSCYMPAS